jgi:NAD(P)-binding Rossmann-like domain
MDQPITRRDFLNGIALGVTAASAPLRSPSMHPSTATFEDYDLVVVGGGGSGLAAAHFYRAHAGAGSRILILDNHDDFGGHAKRNEFRLDGHLHLINGGTLEIDSPRPYGPIPAGLLTTLGVDVAALSKTIPHPEIYEQLGLQRGVFFDRETFGADRLLAGLDKLPFKQFLAQAPLSAAARAQIEQIEEAAVDYLPGLSSEDKKQRLSRISYEAFLRDLVGVEPAVLKYYNARTKGEWGVGTDAVSALDCWGFGLPGFKGMRLAKGSIARMGFTPAGYEDTGGSLKLHFPDGNATIARLLVRNLIPRALPGGTASDAITARAGREELLRTSFAAFEREIRGQLGCTLAPGGFDPARDITAITVNRWPHGYAPEYNPLFDADVPEAQRPHVLGRAHFGKIAIANSDSGGGAYTDVAIEQGHRAVMELLQI